MKRLLMVGAALWATVAMGTFPAPDVIVRENTEKILLLIKSERAVYEKDIGKLHARVDEYVLPHFDFRAMSRLVLARAWRDASEAQRERFTKEFRELLVRTYSTVLLKYNDEKISYLPFKMLPDERTQVVRVEVQLSGARGAVEGVRRHGRGCEPGYQLSRDLCGTRQEGRA